jgi:acetyltransferase-like isoleucine patch superfamily enzyme
MGCLNRFYVQCALCGIHIEDGVIIVSREIEVVTRNIKPYEVVVSIPICKDY